jgi:hypothetical protein
MGWEPVDIIKKAQGSKFKVQSSKFKVQGSRFKGKHVKKL